MVGLAFLVCVCVCVCVWRTVRNESNFEQCPTYSPEKDLIIYAATPPNYPHRCILIDYSNNYGGPVVQSVLATA